jgi:hypothetical protein
MNETLSCKTSECIQEKFAREKGILCRAFIFTIRVLFALQT